MKYLIAVAAASLLTGCAVPTEVQVADPHVRTIDTKTGWTDETTVKKCVNNMINASPANKAVNVQTQYVGTGKSIIVDVSAVLVDFGYWSSSRKVGYKCEYRNGILAKSKWTEGL